MNLTPHVYVHALARESLLGLVDGSELPKLLPLFRVILFCFLVALFERPLQVGFSSSLVIRGGGQLLPSHWTSISFFRCTQASFVTLLGTVSTGPIISCFFALPRSLVVLALSLKFSLFSAVRSPVVWGGGWHAHACHSFLLFLTIIISSVPYQKIREKERWGDEWISFWSFYLWFLCKERHLLESEERRLSFLSLFRTCGFFVKNISWKVKNADFLFSLSLENCLASLFAWKRKTSFYRKQRETKSFLEAHRPTAHSPPM